MHSFSPNQKVICVDDSVRPIYCPVTGPRCFTFPNGFIDEGAIYTIRSVTLDGDGAGAIELVEKPILLNDQPVRWHARRFRRLSETTEPEFVTISEQAPHEVSRPSQPHLCPMTPAQ